MAAHACSDTPHRPDAVELSAPREDGAAVVLIVEDSPSDARLLKESLDEVLAGSARIECVASLRDCRDRLARGGVDLLLLDLELPDSSGLATFEEVARSSGCPAVIITSGLADTRVAEEAVRLGAQDYLTKPVVDGARLRDTVAFASRRRALLDRIERQGREEVEKRDRFLSHVSHELRAPLAVIHQFVSLLLDAIAGPLSEAQTEMLELVARNVDQLRAMVDDLLLADQLERGVPIVSAVRADLGSILSDAVQSIEYGANARHIDLSLWASDLPTVLCDEIRVREVLANLLDNALKFCREDGWIRVEANVAHGEVSVAVSNSGVSIESRNAERVFEQFFQEDRVQEKSRRGLGLGLYLSRQLVAQQGGRMWAERGVVGFTKIVFTLPVAASEEASGA